MNDCCICEGLADYITIEGGWYVCKECVVTGKNDRDWRVYHGRDDC